MRKKEFNEMIKVQGISNPDHIRRLNKLLVDEKTVKEVAAEEDVSIPGLYQLLRKVVKKESTRPLKVTPKVFDQVIALCHFNQTTVDVLHAHLVQGERLSHCCSKSQHANMFRAVQRFWELALPENYDFKTIIYPRNKMLELEKLEKKNLPKNWPSKE